MNIHLFLLATYLVVGSTNQDHSCGDDEVCLMNNLKQKTEYIETNEARNENEKLEHKRSNGKMSLTEDIAIKLQSNDLTANQSIENLSNNDASHNEVIKNDDIETLNNSVTIMIDNLNEENSTSEVFGPETTLTPSTTTSTTASIASSTETITTTSSPPINLFNDTNHHDDICICDLKVNECDVNCCCDQDCSFFHRQAFAKCEDAVMHYDSNHCYKTKLLYKNNTKYKMIENDHQLFCIVKDHLPSRFNYKSKAAIKDLDVFNKNIAQKKLYQFDYGRTEDPSMSAVPYTSGHFIWIFQDKKLTQFKIPANSIGLSCNSAHAVQFMKDAATECSRNSPSKKNECENSNDLSMTYYFRNMNVVVSPALINATDLKEKACQNGSCIPITPYVCTNFPSLSSCSNSTVYRPKQESGECKYVVQNIHYYLFHNGSEGIKQAKAFFWLKDITISQNHRILQRIYVKFRWLGSSENLFERSGNPGYIVGKPIMAGRKVFNTSSENSASKKEAIELSTDSRKWLTAFDNSHGVCSSDLRNPINFREDALHSCSLHLTKDDFDKGKCMELQKRIFDLLIGEDFSNITTNNYFNKFVSTFGNSKVEETGDWVQVLIDLFPIISSQVSLKPSQNGVTCKNVITGMYIEIAYSYFGSFANPQAKILGVLFKFAKPRDLIFVCNTNGCKNFNVVKSYKIFTSIHFIDLTEPAVKKFAEPPGLEAKLPHDFFYPFFSQCSKSCFPSIFCIILMLTLTRSVW